MYNESMHFNGQCQKKQNSKKANNFIQFHTFSCKKIQCGFNGRIVVFIIKQTIEKKKKKINYENISKHYYIQTKTK
jgi:hypothetical protein